MQSLSEKSFKKLLGKYKVYFYYTIIFTIISFLAFYCYITLGKSFIWQTDGLKQHYVILYDFNNIVRNILKDGIYLFSWNMGLGLDIIGQYSYYILGDPFAYISLLFPLKYLKYVYEILVIIRMYFVGIAFIIFCRYNKKELFGTLIGAIVYTFSGFVLFAAVRHPYFTNPVIMLPLIFLGIDKILKEEKYLVFIIMIAILAIMNYYFFYMVTILAFAYAIIKYIIQYRKNGIKDFLNKFLKTFISFIIGVMIAGIILLPTIYAYINSARSGVGFSYYDLEYYEKVIFGQPDTAYWSKTYVASIVLLMIPIGIINIKKIKENRTVLLNILIYIIILFVPFCGSLMNGFSFQSNRWVFAYCFLTSYLVAINLKSDLKYNVKQIIWVLGFVILYIILALKATNVKREFVLLSIAFSAMTITVLIVRNLLKKEHNVIKNICKALIFILVSGNVIIYAYGIYSPEFGEYVEQFIDFSKVDKTYNNYEDKIKDFDKSIDFIKQNDNKKIYRVGTPIYTNNNMSIMHEFKGLNYYLSIGNGHISNLTNELLSRGTGATNALNELDSRTKITTLLGCKYYIVPNGKEDYVPYGYKKIKENKNNKIYVNENNLTIGVFYDNFILKKDYEKLTPLEKEQALLDTAVVEENIKNAKYDESIINEIKSDTTKEVKYKIKDEKNNEKFTVELEEEVKKSELYILFENIKCDENATHSFEVKYGDVSKTQDIKNKITSAYYIERRNILINLGYKDTHKGKITVELDGKGQHIFDIKIIAVPMEKYDKSIQNLKKTEFNVTVCDKDYIRGTINNEKSGVLQISTSYSKGWKAYVDGKETEVMKVNTGFIGIGLDKGEHEIYFKYNTPYLKIGTSITVIGILILIIIIIRSRKRK